MSCGAEVNENNRPQIWDVSTVPPKPLSTGASSKKMTSLMILSFLPDVSYLLDENQLLSVYKDKCSIFDMNIDKSNEQFTISKPDYKYPNCVTVGQKENQTYIAIGYTAGHCEIWNLEARQKIFDFEIDYSITSVCLDMQRGLLVAGSLIGTLQIWKKDENPTKPWKRLGKETKVFCEPIKHLSLQGNILAVGSHTPSSGDKIKLLPIHRLSSDHEICLSKIAGLFLQGTQLVVIHGEPLLRLTRFDFSIPN